jgi:hypothetical protein
MPSAVVNDRAHTGDGLDVDLGVEGVERAPQVAERRVDVGVPERDKGDRFGACPGCNLRGGSLPGLPELVLVPRHREVEVADALLGDVVGRD